ncbi:MAG: Si-specific NAD(P)(+) transhydrogenase [Phycisphaerales bacterium]
MREFDLCVIGSGPAGQRAAITAAKLGQRVCVIEARDVVGGSAINTGTIPSKALREAILGLSSCPTPAIPTNAEFIAAARGATLENLWASANRVIQAEIDLVRQQFASCGIQVIHGTGSFIDANTIKVEGRTGTNTIKAKNIFIAVGTAPSRPHNTPFDAVDIITSDELLELRELPRSMLIVGGGVIGTEYASMMAALGVKVTLIEGKNRLLDFVDAEIIEALQYHLRQAGVTLRLGEKVIKISKVEAPENARGAGMFAEAMLESGKILRADCLLYCVGRQGCTDSLNLKAAGLEADNRGRIVVDKDYRTTVPHIFAGGDVIGFPALASTSMEQGRIAACRMFGARCEAFEELLPYGIYAIPEISMVGWTEERLTQESIPFESGIAHYRETARGQLLGDDIGMLKLLIHQESHAILGVHAIGTGATELIHIGQCAIAFKATVEYFINAVFNYPTLAECYKVAALNGLAKIRGVA